MHLLVINCSPRMLTKSNTNIILSAFLKGYTERGNTAEVHHLSQRGKWEEIRSAFDANTHILMALPLYVECIPGLMLEFLESLAVKKNAAGIQQTKLSFLLQGGFAEASQYRCAERYLRRLPAYLGCEHGGTLIKGDMFITHMFPEDAQQKKVAPFTEMGKLFAKEGGFPKAQADAFAGPEYLSKGYILFAGTLLSPVQKLFFEHFFKKNGCIDRLSARPYQKYLEEK